MNVPQFVETLDFDLDGDQDLAVSRAGQDVNLFANDGNGVFSFFANLPTGVSGGVSYGIVSADFNNDGSPDLATTNFQGTTNGPLTSFRNSQATVPANLTVTLSEPSDQLITVDYTVSGILATAGVDFVDTPGQVTFQPGQTSQNLSVPVLPDLIAEPTENFVVTLSNASSGTIGDAEGHVTIVDDDGGVALPTLSISDASVTEGDVGIVNVSVTVSISGPPSGLVSVDVSTVDGTATAGTDYVALAGQTVTLDSMNLSQTVTLQLTGDLRNEGDEQFFVVLSNPVGVVILDSQGVISILDDDSAQPAVSPDDIVLGGSGNDTLSGSIGDDSFNGGSGRDLIRGNGGNDSVRAGSGDDTVDGGSGDDTIDGQGGDDDISTGTGNDLVKWNGAGSGVDVIQEALGAQRLRVMGGSNSNAFSVDSTSQLLRVSEGAASITISNSTNEVSILGGNGDDSVTVGNISDVRPLALDVDGQNGNDTISASGSLIGNVSLTLRGGAGDDTISGSRGMDVIRGDDGDDLLSGGDGIDVINGDSGNDVLNGDSGNDLLNGGDNNDTLNGNDGNDSLQGSFGNDVLMGDVGNDTLRGGFGNDILNGAAGNDLADGNQDNDRVLGGAGDDSLDGGTGDDTVTGQAGNDQIKGGDGNDRIEGNSGSDTINGGDGDDTIDGGNGRDMIDAGDGNDSVNGMAGRDTLIGGDGNDTLLGGGGVDRIFGGNGTDTLRGNGSIDKFNSGEGGQTPKDLGVGETDDQNLTIELSVLAALAELNGF